VSPAASRDRAITVADEIRRSFADATREVDGRPVVASVSIGVVISYDAVLDVSALLAQADHARSIAPRTTVAIAWNWPPSN
jgi:PleD family two-component response regulator